MLRKVSEAACERQCLSLEVLTPSLRLDGVGFLLVGPCFVHGITFVGQVKQHPKHRFTPVIMLTTEGQDGKKEQGRAAGAKAWIMKPFNPPQLLDAVSKLILP